MQREYTLKDVEISKRSIKRLRWMRRILPPLMNLLGMLPVRVRVRFQRNLAAQVPDKVQGFTPQYYAMGGVPGVMLGELDPQQKPRVVLYLHGGAFIAPIIANGHLALAGKLANQLDADAFVPDYRLAPLNVYPAALDDCDLAYQALLDRGYEAKNILVAGESAGGNLTLGLLQRIRQHDLPQPACAIPISPVAEMARVHAPPSRADNAKRDAMLPAKSFVNMLMDYAPGEDGGDPQLSPLIADFTGLPPLYFLVGETEILLDDSLICARRAKEDGVETEIDVWPALPHAFPLLSDWLPEAKLSVEDMVQFAKRHLAPATGEMTDVTESAA